jgi:chromosome segregation ATPase
MLGEIQKSLDETLQSLSENRMTSQDIGEKIENIQRLIEEIDSDALKKYIEEMRAAMEKLDPKQIQQALENMNTSTADLLKNLERTEALLKEIQREQQMEELVRKTKDLMEAQEAVSDSTARADDKETMDKLSREQEELAEQAADLENNLDETSKDLDDKDIADQLQKASEKNSMSRTSKEMKEASSQLQEGQKNQAMSHQEQAMQNLIGLFGSLANLQMQMQMNSNNQLSANLQRLANNTLDISFKEESLTARMREQISAGEDPDRVAIRELAEEQQKYARAVGQIADELFEMSKETFMVPRALIQALGTCKKSMENSLLFLEQNKAFMSAASATEATTTLNAITIDLLRTCKNCSSGGSGKPQGSPMLQKLLAGQQQVLKETEQLLALRAAQERLVQEMQADVKRLAGEQRSLREIAEDMKNDLKQNERVLGRMDKIAEEMDEVIKDLESGDVNEGTLQKEERILSRLLDAQRSVHTRDYEKDRVSRTAGDVYSKPSAASSVQPASQLLREEIRRAMALKAPGEFEDLIRLYFRALAEETSPAPGTE